jgi:hypothetical protein
MWLIHREQTENCKILHGRTGREFRLPELPRLSVDGYCPDTKNFTNFAVAFSSATLYALPRYSHSSRRRHSRTTIWTDNEPPRTDHTCRLPGAFTVGMWIWQRYIASASWIEGPQAGSAGASEHEMCPVRVSNRSPAPSLQCSGRRNNSVLLCYIIIPLYMQVCQIYVEHLVVHAGETCRDIDAMF